MPNIIYPKLVFLTLHKLWTNNLTLDTCDGCLLIYHTNTLPKKTHVSTLQENTQPIFHTV